MLRCAALRCEGVGLEADSIAILSPTETKEAQAETTSLSCASPSLSPVGVEFQSRQGEVR